jgi:hypothetical protein
MNESESCCFCLGFVCFFLCLQKRLLFLSLTTAAATTAAAAAAAVSSSVFS